MSEQNTGGPAFPQPPDYEVNEGRDGYTITPTTLSATESASGMTLRDYFAAKALQNGFRSMFIEEDQTYAQIACHCYEMADAMLKERSIGK